MRGRMPLEAHTLRWYYGLVVDPYPLTMRRADGRVQVVEIAGDAWSRTIDLSGQFQRPRAIDTLAPIVIVALILIPLALRFATSRAAPRNPRKTRNHETTKRKFLPFRGFVVSRFRG